jgi:hypothetical protein
MFTNQRRKSSSMLSAGIAMLGVGCAALAPLAMCPSAGAVVTSYSTDFDSMTTGSIVGQDGWQNLHAGGYPYVEGVTTAASHSGSQSWLLSNASNDGTVRTIGTPTFASVGESNTVFGGTPAYNQFSESLWFRSVSTTNDPGLYISNSLGTAASVRDTYFRVSSDSAGNLLFDAIGNWDPSIGDFAQDPTSAPLTWGAWYQVKETATFVDGPNNDTVRYQLLDSSGNTVMDTTIGSWEGYYSDPNNGAEDAPGPIASNQVSWGLAGSPGVQGIYMDDLSLSVGVASVPEPTSLGLISLAGVAVLRRRRSRA